jgi:hypothetical protein
MANKFEGHWHYHFIDTSGNLTSMGQFHLPMVESNGNLKNATDDDQTPLSGEITMAGPFQTIHLNRASGPQRHLRGILSFEGKVNGVDTMILVGERRRLPFPLPPDREDKAKTDPDELGQTDGTWVATKP